MITTDDKQLQEEQEQREQQQRQKERMEEWQRQCIGRERYANCRLRNFDVTTAKQKEVVDQLRHYAANMGENVAAGRGILIFGPAGTGKTHLLAAMLRLAVLDWGVKVEWTRGVDILATARQAAAEAAKRLEEDRHPQYAQLGPSYRHARRDILAIDDVAIPGEPLRWEGAVRMHQLIDGAYQAQQAVFATINANTKAEMQALVGGQIVDRLADGALVLHCNWLSHREPA